MLLSEIFNSIDSEESVYGKNRPIRFSLYKKFRAFNATK